MTTPGWMIAVAGFLAVAAAAGLVALIVSWGDAEDDSSDDGIRDCGTYSPDDRPGAEMEGFQCAAAAFAAGQHARLEVTFQTDEGGFVTNTFKVKGQVVRVSEDHGQDPMSDGGVGERDCHTWDLDLERGELMPQDCTVVIEPVG